MERVRDREKKTASSSTSSSSNLKFLKPQEFLDSLREIFSLSALVVVVVGEEEEVPQKTTLVSLCTQDFFIAAKIRAGNIFNLVSNIL